MAETGDPTVKEAMARLLKRVRAELVPEAQPDRVDWISPAEVRLSWRKGARELTYTISVDEESGDAKAETYWKDHAHPLGMSGGSTEPALAQLAERIAWLQTADGLP